MVIRPAHLAAACMLALAAGCGSGTPATLGQPAAAAAPGPLTAAQAKAVAAAGVLTAADLPGYKFKKNVRDTSAQGPQAQFDKCMGTKSQPFIARDHGYTFTRNQTAISSSADIASTPAQARADVQLFTSEKGKTCSLKILEGTVTKQGFRIRSSKVAAVPVKVPGAQASFGLSFEITATKAGRSGHLQALLLGAVVGQAEIGLALRPGAHPVTLADGVSFLTAAVARAEAAADGRPSMPKS